MDWAGGMGELGAPLLTHRLTCGFIFQLGLLQALLTLYLNHLQVLTLMMRAGYLAALRTKQTEGVSFNYGPEEQEAKLGQPRWNQRSAWGGGGSEFHTKCPLWLRSSP